MGREYSRGTRVIHETAQLEVAAGEWAGEIVVSFRDKSQWREPTVYVKASDLRAIMRKLSGVRGV